MQITNYSIKDENNTVNVPVRLINKNYAFLECISWLNKYKITVHMTLTSVKHTGGVFNKSVTAKVHLAISY